MCLENIYPNSFLNADSTFYSGLKILFIIKDYNGNDSPYSNRADVNWFWNYYPAKPTLADQNVGKSAWYKII